MLENASGVKYTLMVQKYAKYESGWGNDPRCVVTTVMMTVLKRLNKNTDQFGWKLVFKQIIRFGL